MLSCGVHVLCTLSSAVRLLLPSEEAVAPCIVVYRSFALCSRENPCRLAVLTQCAEMRPRPTEESMPPCGSVRLEQC